MVRATLAAAVVIAWPSRAAVAEPLVVAPARASMTLAEALAHARDHQPLIRSALARLRVRQSEARIPRAAWLPQIGATAQVLVGTANNTTASYLTVPEVDLPRIGGTRSSTGVNMTPSASTLVAVGIGQEIWDFGKLAAQTAAADALADESRADVRAVELDVALSVEESFDSVLAARGILGASEDAFKRSTAHRDFAQAGVKSGLRPPVDLTRAEADLALADVRRIRAANGVVAARSALAAAIGSDALQIDAAAAAREGATGSPGLDEALEVARHKNPALLAGLAQIRAQEATSRAIGREMLPNLFGMGTLSARAGGAAPSSGDVPVGQGWLPDVLNWHVGIVMQWNAFDATVLARRDVSRAREEQRRADLATTTSQVLLTVQRAYLDLQAAQDVIPGLAQSASAAQANQAQADARFRAGLGTVVELADAEALLVGAQLELAVGRFAADRARAQLGRAIGIGAAASSGAAP